MQVPALYCGLADDVRKVVRKQVRAYIRGASWLEAIDGPMVHTSDVPGLIYLEGPSFTGTPKTPQIYLYLPYLEAFRAVERQILPRSRLDDIRTAALESDWGAAVMLGGLCVKGFVRSADCWIPLLRCALERWGVLDGEGARYSNGTAEGKRLWVVAGGLHYCVSGLGIRGYPMGRGIVFEPRSFLSEHGLLEKVMAATAHP